MRRILSYRFTLLVLLGLLLSVAAERVSGEQVSLAPLLALTVPVWLALTALLALGWALRRRRIALLPVAALALAWPQVQRGLPLHWAGLQALASGYKSGLLAQPAPPRSLRLLSANVRIFNVYAHLRKADPTAPAKAMEWLATSPADVLCLQEFYQEPTGTRSSDGDLFRVADKLGPGSGRQVFVSKSLTNSMGAQFGLAIFSRLPIVGRGEIAFGRLSQNHAMWVDVAGPRPGDTVRVFNAHLQSMSMDESDLVAAGSSKAGLRSKGRGLLGRFVRGAAARAWQADTLVARIVRSPYPVLLAGDCNDLPYSYSYNSLAGSLQNAWATVGFGPGNTYHGRLPPLLRIDQQFAGPQWQVLACRVHTEIPYSDHFPVEALYRLK
ncbi:endonuclease/exonuclease/phosphatase family protein [Siccationidurans ginsengisoli]|uniref:endonuclease/exonuclease/phosphatase family protein n=1 Tax=Hymenobacter TaxID=89966 RepID=UPI001AAE0FD9|nr:endonuclease/exonuclease/phosphatase family protein [Hymenobacter sp. KCTC 23674]MBO2032880.1 endonuclease/exonuclease/phosphatase family protein [Hymenobacter sp. BT559]